MRPRTPEERAAELVGVAHDTTKTPPWCVHVCKMMVDFFTKEGTAILVADLFRKPIAAAIRAAVLEEREACARLCEELSKGEYDVDAEECAEAIRKRGD